MAAYSYLTFHIRYVQYGGSLRNFQNHKCSLSKSLGQGLSWAGPNKGAKISKILYKLCSIRKGLKFQHPQPELHGHKPQSRFSSSWFLFRFLRNQGTQSGTCLGIFLSDFSQRIGLRNPGRLLSVGWGEQYEDRLPISQDTEGQCHFMNNLVATGVRQPTSSLGLGPTCQPVLTHHIKPPQHREQRGGSQRGGGQGRDGMGGWG